MPSPSVAIFVQARLTSARLPGKVLKKVGERPLLTFLLDRLLRCDLPIFLLTPEKETKIFLDFLENIYPKTSLHHHLNHHHLLKKKIIHYGGSEKNVLKRFFSAATKYPFNHYVRVTADNPFTCEKSLLTIVKKHLEKNVSQKKIDLSYLQGLPYGAGVEVISQDTLLALHHNPLLTKVHREHVTLYIHQNPQYFSLQMPQAPKNYHAPKLRLTVDTQRDFEHFATRIKKHNGMEKIVPLVQLIESQHDDDEE